MSSQVWKVQDELSRVRIALSLQIHIPNHGQRTCSSSIEQAKIPEISWRKSPSLLGDFSSFISLYYSARKSQLSFRIFMICEYFIAFSPLRVSHFGWGTFFIRPTVCPSVRPSSGRVKSSKFRNILDHKTSTKHLQIFLNPNYSTIRRASWSWTTEV